MADVSKLSIAEEGSMAAHEQEGFPPTMITLPTKLVRSSIVARDITNEFTAAASGLGIRSNSNSRTTLIQNSAEHRATGQG